MHGGREGNVEVGMGEGGKWRGRHGGREGIGEVGMEGGGKCRDRHGGGREMER